MLRVHAGGKVTAGNIGVLLQSRCPPTNTNASKHQRQHQQRGKDTRTYRFAGAFVGVPLVSRVNGQGVYCALVNLHDAARDNTSHAHICTSMHTYAQVCTRMQCSSSHFCPASPPLARTQRYHMHPPIHGGTPAPLQTSVLDREQSMRVLHPQTHIPRLQQELRKNQHQTVETTTTRKHQSMRPRGGIGDAAPKRRRL